MSSTMVARLCRSAYKYVMRPDELDRDDPVTTEVERQLFVQTIDERRAVLVEERDEPDGPLLGVAAREGERAGVDELAAQRFVAALGGLNHLAVERLQITLHPLERRAGGAFERRIQCRQRLDEPRHLRVDRLGRCDERLVNDRWNLCLEQLVQRRFVLCLQRLERKLVLREEAER